MSVKEKMKRLEDARNKADEISRQKERLTGQVEEMKKRVDELEAKSRDEFNCEVSEIPDLVEELDAEATEAIKKAEGLLGIESEEDDEDDIF